MRIIRYGFQGLDWRVGLRNRLNGSQILLSEGFTVATAALQYILESPNIANVLAIYMAPYKIGACKCICWLTLH